MTRIGKFRPGIAYIICTNQFHLPKNGRQSIYKTGIKVGFEEMKHEFPFEFELTASKSDQDW